MPRSRHAEDGFTLVELLVIVVIIGILAAIAVPAFLGQSRGASDARAKSDLSNAQRALESFWAERGTYSATRGDLAAVEGAVGQALNLTVSGTDRTYRLSADSKRGGTFVLEKTAAGGLERTCAPADTGACLPDSTW